MCWRRVNMKRYKSRKTKHRVQHLRVPGRDQESGCCPPAFISQALPAPAVIRKRGDTWCHDAWWCSVDTYLGRGRGAVAGWKTELPELGQFHTRRKSHSLCNTNSTLSRMLEVEGKTTEPWPSFPHPWPRHSLSRAEETGSSQIPEMGKNILTKRENAWPKGLWRIIGVLMPERPAQGRYQA